jgi:thioesterase domain-containing protein
VTVPALLAELRRREIQVWADGGQLRCAAKAGALTPELREQLREWKNDILKLLASGQALAMQERAIVPLQASGTRTAIFAVPGHNGDVFCFRALARHLGADQPFYGLQPPGVDGQGEPLARVEELAACFARQIRAFQPRGPYIIAGYCAGGTVAFELAQQLTREGAEVSTLALFGSPYPAFYRFPAQLLLRIAEQATRIVGLARDLAVRSPAEWRGYLADRLGRRRERISAAAATAADPMVALRAKVEHATIAAARAYAPREFTGRVALFLPSREWERGRRWRSVAPGVQEYAGPDGCGSQEMLREPHAAAFSELFRRAAARPVGP